MGKDVLNRERANELLLKYNESLKSLKKIKLKIDNRFNDLVNRYGDIIEVGSIKDSIDKIKYIRSVEDYIESQNKIKQGNLF
jgi:hypothetical protein